MTSTSTEQSLPSLSHVLDKIKDAVHGPVKRGVPTVSLQGNFKAFKNIIHFITDPEGLALNSLWNFNRQYQYIRDFYSLVCPNCTPQGVDFANPYDCWGKTPAQLNDDVLFAKNPAGFYECPNCHKLQSDFNMPRYNELIGVCGMRSGKTMLAALILL